jgi:hypothetical protein
VVQTEHAIFASTFSGLFPLFGCFFIIGYKIFKGTAPISASHFADPRIWLVIWTIAASINVVMPLKFFAHYYFALYPPMCLAAASALNVLLRERLRFALGLLVLFLPPTVVWAFSAERVSSTPDAPRAIGKYLKEAGAGDRSVFVYEYNPIIYALAEVAPPTKFVLGSELTAFSHSSGTDGSEEINRVMVQKPKYVVMVSKTPYNPKSSHLDQLMKGFLASYVPVWQMQDESNSVVKIYTSQPGNARASQGDAIDPSSKAQ